VSAFLDALVRRRTALIERSTAQRGEVAAAVAGVRRAAAEPLLLGAGVAATLLTSSPKLRGWVVRAWAVYAFVRRLLDR
jgi:NAD/NADP transhydrogenase alpha subunit